jgi:hypothetical protein
MRASDGTVAGSLPLNGLPVGALAVDRFGAVFLGGDGFLSKLNGKDWSSLFVSDPDGSVVALAVDRAGTAYAALSVGDDAVIGKLAADGTWDFRVTLGPATPAALVWDAGALYVTGATASPDFPTHRAGQAWLNGRSDAFATRIEATDGQVLWSTYLGGAGADAGTSVAIAESTIAAIGGYTSSKDFPRARADLPGWQGGEDGFVAYLHVAQATVLESSYIGTALDDRVLALAVVGNRLEVGGSTGATTVVVPS